MVNKEKRLSRFHCISQTIMLQACISINSEMFYKILFHVSLFQNLSIVLENLNYH